MSDSVIICGGGALGSHALFLARGLRADFSVIDFDRVETRNLQSQWFVKQMVGKNKATALKMQMLNFYGVKVSDHGVRLTASNIDVLLGPAKLVVDGFDNAESRLLVQDFARAQGIPCVHAGLAADGAFGAVRWDAHFVVDTEDTPGHPTCEGGNFLPFILRVSSALVRSVELFLEEDREVNWNISPDGAESF